MRVVLDMYYGETYSPERHYIPEIFWNDADRYYWGWIYNRKKVVGDFKADNIQDAEKEFGVKWR